jgi:hypothetical protein
MCSYTYVSPVCHRIGKTKVQQICDVFYKSMVVHRTEIDTHMTDYSDEKQQCSRIFCEDTYPFYLT